MARSSFLFRADPEVLKALRRWADDDLRSVNAQLEFIVRKALRDAGREKKTRDKED
ncbi:MAG: Arc family DNA binding domain-containing protein [Pseudomonadota bacterium]